MAFHRKIMENLFLFRGFFVRLLSSRTKKHSPASGCARCAVIMDFLKGCMYFCFKSFQKETLPAAFCAETGAGLARSGAGCGSFAPFGSNAVPFCFLCRGKIFQNGSQTARRRPDARTKKVQTAHLLQNMLPGSVFSGYGPSTTASPGPAPPGCGRGGATPATKTARLPAAARRRRPAIPDGGPANSSGSCNP